MTDENKGWMEDEDEDDYDDFEYSNCNSDIECGSEAVDDEGMTVFFCCDCCEYHPY